MVGDCVLIGGLWESEIELQNRKTHKISSRARLQDHRLLSDLSVESKEFEKLAYPLSPFFASPVITGK